MTDTYANIRAALSAGPTPGPWEQISDYEVYTELGATNASGQTAHHEDGWNVATCAVSKTWCNGQLIEMPASEFKANAAYIAACSPDVIRALLAERDALHNSLTEMIDVAEKVDGWPSFPQELIDNARAALAQGTVNVD